MRTAALIFLSVVGLALLAGLYVWMQPTVQLPTAVAQRPPTTRPARPRPPATTSDAGSVIQHGENAWIEELDDKTHQVSRRFRFASHDPQPDGTVDLTQPQAEFFFQDGQVVAIEGVTGKFVLPGGQPGNAADFRGPIVSPSRGELHDVTVRLFPNTDRRRAVMTFTVNNVSFDNDTFRIATEQFTQADGTVVPADQVPVKLRGDDYDFDGRGLTIRWNDRDRRLEMLEVAHGESLTIKSSQMLGGGEGSGSADSSRGAASGTARSSSGSAPASPRARRPASNVSAPVVAAPTTGRARPDDPTYRATFEGPVTATQSGVQIASAQTMFVDFRSQPDDSSGSSPTTPPPAGRAVARRAAASRPAVSRGPAAGASPPNLVPPASGPSAADPIILRWPGRLVVVPLEPGQAPALKPGDRRIEMISTDAPVVLNRDGREIQCGSFVYTSSDDSLVVKPQSADTLILMKDAKGASFHTPSLVYDGTARKAVLQGASHAEIPLASEKGGPDELMTAKWSKSCILTLIGPSRDEMTIDHAVIEGDIDIEHPRLKLLADSTRVDFSPPEAPVPGAEPETTQRPRQQVRQVQSDGNVICDMLDDQQQPMHITTDHLGLTTARSDSGRMVPSLVKADGNVHTVSQDRQLWAGHLDARLKPTTRPSESPGLQNLEARSDVRFALKDATGQCDILRADADGDDYDITLTGQQPLASITSRDSTLCGPMIIIKPRQQDLLVSGAGTLRGMARRTPADPATPFDLKWDNELSMKGAQNHVEAIGRVVLQTTVASDGSRVQVNGEKAALELMDDPDARPQAAAPASAPATRPAGTDFASSFDALKTKTVRSIVVDADPSDRDTPLLWQKNDLAHRSIDLFAPRLQVDAEARRAVIPSGGRMLVQDLGGATTRPASTAPTSAPTQAGPLRGITAFKWDDKLTYDQQASRADMTGGVVIDHREPAGGSAGQWFRLEAPHVSAEFENQDSSASKKAKATTQPSDLKLKLLTADGGARFSSSDIGLLADRLSYDQASGILTALGTEGAPVQIIDSRGISSGSANGVHYNTITHQIEEIRDMQFQYRQ